MGTLKRLEPSFFLMKYICVAAEKPREIGGGLGHGQLQAQAVKMVFVSLFWAGPQLMREEKYI